MKPLRVLAAGSLRHVWPAIIDQVVHHYPQGIETQFAPAGLLRQRIEQGEPCDLFVSANMAHPLQLQQEGLAQQVSAFCQNTLCLNVRQQLAAQSWLQLLRDPTLRIATSTPGSDPCGDYAWQMFDHLEQWDNTLGKALKQRAMTLVGGESSSPVPAGKQAASWIIQSGMADIFIGYSSYANQPGRNEDISTVPIPAEWQPAAIYGFAVCHPDAQRLAAFLLAEEGQEILRQHGFSAVA